MIKIKSQQKIKMIKIKTNQKIKMIKIKSQQKNKNKKAEEVGASAMRPEGPIRARREARRADARDTSRAARMRSIRCVIV